jgi:hypothetical protein
MVSRTGPPTQARKHTAKGHGLRLGAAPLGEPVVATLERAAYLLDCEPARLAEALDGLEPWGSHASGQPVWRWPELCQAANQAGIPAPTTRPTLADWRQYRAAQGKRERKRGKANRERRKGGP